MKNLLENLSKIFTNSLRFNGKSCKAIVPLPLQAYGRNRG